MAKITVLPFGHSCDAEAQETILSAILRSGAFIKYGCRHGGCGTCKAFLVDGDVDEEGSTFALPASERAEGWVLACSTVPAGDCVIDITAMDLDEDDFLAGDRIGVCSTVVESIEVLTADIRALRLRLVDPATFGFVAGQFVNVEIPGGNGDVRAYSMANAPSADGVIDLIIKVLPGGRFSGWLTEQAVPGDAVTVHGPLGELKVRLSHRPMVMIAGGSGLAPILSMLTDLAEHGNTRPVTLFFGARTVADLYATDRIAAVAEAMPGLTFVSVLSEAWPADWGGETGMVTDAVARLLPNLTGWDAYLCGPPPMIDAAMALLTERGVKRRNIYFDAFVPTGGPAVAGGVPSA